MTFYYRPTVTEAFASVQYIMTEANFGWLIRSVHRWSASMMVLMMIPHVFRVYLTGGFKKPRELTWVTGVVLAVLTASFGVTGYSLPRDQIGYWAVKIVTGVPEAIPVIGLPLVELLRGSASVGQSTLTRFYSLHTFVLPLLTAVFMLMHFLMILVILGTIACNVGLAVLEPSMIGEPADPFATPLEILPECVRSRRTTPRSEEVVHSYRSKAPPGVRSACKNDTGYETMPNSITELRDFILKNVQDFHHHVSRPSYRYRKPCPAWIDSVPFPPGISETTLLTNSFKDDDLESDLTGGGVIDENSRGVIDENSGGVIDENSGGVIDDNLL
ncbi:hypothetical protein V6N11_021422 [Hibiscus sabdariffa]|uniref:Cytochrome b/b6 N-terminal region profile domain-containing protein n=1 Tax=Hibiscus sabdariffa TaxID=183260 RepID=A0ABR2A404_9ROSI